MRQLTLQRLLRDARLKAGLTQKQLAARLDTPHSRISDYERGERRLDLVQLVEYCAALDLDVRAFVDRFVIESQSQSQGRPTTTEANTEANTEE